MLEFWSLLSAIYKNPLQITLISQATCYEKTSNAEIISFSNFANAHIDDSSDVQINGDKISYAGGEKEIEKGQEKSGLGLRCLTPVDTDDIVCDERTSCLSEEHCIVPINLIEGKDPPPPY